MTIYGNHNYLPAIKLTVGMTVINRQSQTGTVTKVVTEGALVAFKVEGWPKPQVMGRSEMVSVPKDTPGSSHRNDA